MTCSTCPICRSTSLRQACCVSTTVIWRCCACGHGWWDWSGYDFTTFYDAAYYHGGHDTDKGYGDYSGLRQSQLLTARRRLRRIRKACPGTRKLLDVGCGLGFFLEQALAEQWTARGYELSAYAASFVRERLKLVVYEGELDAVQETFDVVTAWDVLEHVTDTIDFLASLKRRITPYGRIVLSTGNFASVVARLSGARWHLFNLPEHVAFFTPASLRIAAQHAGLVVDSIRHPAAYYPVAYLRERLRKKLHLSLPRTCLDSLSVPVNLYDVMEVFLRIT